uniref:C-type lectin domain-containing protein n=1 Tax=Pygocentrus nattereri TaxID=42514 RepID=A0A3B4CT97_PYGNA
MSLKKRKPALELANKELTQFNISNRCSPSGPICPAVSSYSNRFISMYSTMKTWHDAQAYCRQYHTDLATVDNETDNQQLKSMVIGQWSAWFGLFRDTWKWSDQSNASSINWLFGSPNNYGGNKNCGLVNGDYIDDAPCSNLLPFFCHTSNNPKMNECSLFCFVFSNHCSVAGHLLYYCFLG